MDASIFDGCTAILGRTGSGKSFFARTLVEDWLEEKRRVCVIDPTSVWHGLRSNAAGDGPGYPVIVFGGDHGDVPIGDRSGERIAEIVGSRNTPAVICTAEMTAGERHRFMTDFLGKLYRTNRLPLHLVVDEADDIGPQQPLPENRRMLGDIDRIVRRGRVRGFRVMMITQRPAVLNKNLLSMAGVLVAMRLPGPQDRAAVDAWIKGQAAGDEATTVMSTLPGMPRGEGWVWAPEDGVLERKKFRTIRTFDSMRTPEIGEEIPEPTRLAAVELGDLRKLLEPEVQADHKSAGGAGGAGGAGAAAVAPDPKLIEAAEQRGEQRGYERGRLDERAFHLGMLAKLEEQFEKLKSAFNEWAAHNLNQPAPVIIDQESSTAAPASQEPRQRKGTVPAVAPVPQNGDKPHTGPEQRVIDAIAWWLAVRIETPTRIQVAMVAGYKPTSGGFNNLLSKLHTSRCVCYPVSGSIALTEIGRSVAQRPATPPTTQALHDRIYDLLTASQARVLSAVIAAYPAPVDRDALGSRTGYSPTSGGFNNLLSQLRSLKLIDYPSKGQVIAEPILFIDHRPRAVG